MDYIPIATKIISPKISSKPLSKPTTARQKQKREIYPPCCSANLSDSSKTMEDICPNTKVQRHTICHFITFSHTLAHGYNCVICAKWDQTQTQALQREWLIIESNSKQNITMAVLQKLWHSWLKAPVKYTSFSLNERFSTTTMFIQQCSDVNQDLRYPAMSIQDMISVCEQNINNPYCNCNLLNTPFE